ncbi:hypothetical protein [Paraconexibacter sp.]|uniref:hypothetical protein n=1 Tax=Paraconexibacter sp. TaxID=2949640 RepID=UPI003564AF4F
MPLPPHHDQPGAANPDRAAQRREARARRLRTLRKRVAGGAVAVFLAAWVAIYVPAQRDAASVSSGTTPTETSTSPTPATTDERSDFAELTPDESDDLESADDSYEVYEEPESSYDESLPTDATPAAPMTSGQS